MAPSLKRGSLGLTSVVGVVLLCLLVDLIAQPVLGQGSVSGVCERIEEQDYQYVTLQLSTCDVTESSTCGLWLWSSPCNKTIYVPCNRTVTSTGRRNVTVTTCCEGWATASNGSCIPGACSLSCGSGGSCVLTPGGAVCRCVEGLAGDTCQTDVNECDQSNGGCEKLCQNIYGSYKCACPDDYSLSDDGTSCLAQPNSGGQAMGLNGDDKEMTTMPLSPGYQEQTSDAVPAWALWLVAILVVLIVIALVASLVAFFCLRCRKRKRLAMDRIQLAEKGANLYSTPPGRSSLQGVDGPQADADLGEDQGDNAGDAAERFVTIEDEMRIPPQLTAQNSCDESVTFDNSRYSDFHVYANMQFRNGQPLLLGDGRSQVAVTDRANGSIPRASREEHSANVGNSTGNTHMSLEDSGEHTYEEAGGASNGYTSDEPDYATADNGEELIAGSESFEPEYATADQPGIRSDDGLYELDYAVADHPEDGVEECQSLKGEFDPDYATPDDPGSDGAKFGTGEDEPDYATADNPEGVKDETESLGGVSDHSYDSLPDRPPSKDLFDDDGNERNPGVLHSGIPRDVNKESNIYDRPVSEFIYDDTLSPKKDRAVSMFAYDDTDLPKHGSHKEDCDIIIEDYDYPNAQVAGEKGTPHDQGDYETFDGPKSESKDGTILRDIGTKDNAEPGNQSVCVPEDDYEGIDQDIADNVIDVNVPNVSANLMCVNGVLDDDYEGVDPLNVSNESEGLSPTETYLFHDFNPSAVAVNPEASADDDMLYDDNVVSRTLPHPKSLPDAHNTRLENSVEVVGDMDDNYETFDDCRAMSEHGDGDNLTMSGREESHTSASSEVPVSQVEDDWEPEDTYVYHDLPIRSSKDDVNVDVPPPRPPKTRFGPMAYKPVPDLPKSPSSSVYNKENLKFTYNTAEQVLSNNVRDSTSVDEDVYEPFEDVAREVAKLQQAADSSQPSKLDEVVYDVCNGNSPSQTPQVSVSSLRESELDPETMEDEYEPFDQPTKPEDLIYQSIGEVEASGDRENIKSVEPPNFRKLHDGIGVEFDVAKPCGSDHPSLDYDDLECSTDMSGSRDADHDYDDLDSSPANSDNKDPDAEDEYETFDQCIYNKAEQKDSNSVDLDVYDNAALRNVVNTDTPHHSDTAGIGAQGQPSKKADSPVLWAESSLYDSQGGEHMSYLSNEDSIYENLPCRVKAPCQRTGSSSTYSHSDAESVYANLPLNPPAELSHPGNRDSGIYEEFGGNSSLIVEDDSVPGYNLNEGELYDVPRNRLSGHAPLTRLQSQLDIPVPVPGAESPEAEDYLTMSPAGTKPISNIYDMETKDQTDCYYPMTSPADHSKLDPYGQDGDSYLPMSSHSSFVEEEPIYENRDSLLRKKKGRSSQPASQIYESVHNPGLNIHHPTQESEA